MNKEQTIDELERLVRLISDDNELLNRANNFMKHLADSKNDITAQLEEREKKAEEKHQ